MPPKKAGNNAGKGAKSGGGQKEEAAGKEKKGNTIKVFSLKSGLSLKTLVFSSQLGSPHSLRKTIKGFRGDGKNQIGYEVQRGGCNVF